MSKIRKLFSNQNIFHAKLKSLYFNNRYWIINEKIMKDNFFNTQTKTKKQSLFGNGNVDDLTQKELKQYEQKISLLREQKTKFHQQINSKYKQIQQKIHKEYQQKLKSLKNTQNQEMIELINDQYEDKLDQIKDKRMDQILSKELVQTNKMQSLTSQYQKKFIKARRQYETQYVKKYMLENVKEFGQKQPQRKLDFQQELTRIIQNQHSYIPNDLVLKKLAFKTSDKQVKDILLAGVQKNDQNHCVYLKKLIQKMKMKNVLTMLSPDLPYFIKTQTSYTKQWKQFITKPSSSYKFYLNPNPKMLQDIKLTKTQIPLVLNSMTKSKSFYQTTYSLMQLNEVNYKYQHQPIYSGLISKTIENVYFCDYPFLKQRQMIALNVNLQDLRDLIKRYTYYKIQKKQNFSAELLLPKNVVQKKFNHIIKLAKTLALTSEQPPILICQASIAQVLSEQWKKSTPKFLQYNYSQNDYFLDLDLLKIPQKPVMFMQFIQKLVILDIILTPLIQNYFVKYESFPYSCKNTVGGKQNLSRVFILWRHYYELYSKAVKGKNPKQELEC